MRAILLAVTLLLWSSTLFAEVFTWTDSQGTQHFTDDSRTIPPKYRKKAVPLKGFDQPEEAPVVAKPAVSTAAPVALSKREEQPNTPPQPQTELDRLAKSLLESASTDRDKAYAAFAWIRSNIYYDNASKWQRRYGQHGGDQSPEGVLAAKRGVCEGMANLFAALTEKMGLPSAVVTGRASGFRQEAHAWNAVKVDGKWGLVDVTRHSFLNPPEDFLNHHFPNDPQWQLLEKPLTYQEWLKR
ncbi:transglutaminase domain-containing protein [Geomonas sp. Red276]